VRGVIGCSVGCEMRCDSWTYDSTFLLRLRDMKGELVVMILGNGKARERAP
jgi:hypothetical protein